MNAVVRENGVRVPAGVLAFTGDHLKYLFEHTACRAEQDVDIQTDALVLHVVDIPLYAFT